MNRTKNKYIRNPEGKRLPGKFVIFILTVFLFLAVIFSFTLGRYPVGMRELIGIFLNRIPFLCPNQFWTDTQAIAVLNIRLPRIFLATLVGAGLSSAGAVYQGVFQNPIASPDILGASAGAGFGAALAFYFELHNPGITILAFAMSLITVFLVFSSENV